MIHLKSPDEIVLMRKAGRLAANLLDAVTSHVREGISTLELNDFCEDYTRSHGATSAPFHYHGFPRSICASVNDVVCHGIPSEKIILTSGDIVNLDVTVKLDGYHGDSSRTFMVGEVDEQARLLVERTAKALDIGLSAVRPGGNLSDIGNSIADYIEPFGYGIVRALGGHGIGRRFHEDPFVYHHRQRVKGPTFKPGMTFTIEPMINDGSHEVYVDPDDHWTVRTRDQCLSAQFEHTVLVTETGVEILTLP